MCEVALLQTFQLTIWELFWCHEKEGGGLVSIGQWVVALYIFVKLTFIVLKLEISEVFIGY